MIKIVPAQQVGLHKSIPVNLTVNYETVKVQPIFDYPLESLRGIAALLVVVFHVGLGSPAIDPQYSLPAELQFQAPAHLSVIIFFMLSGYVIGITNAKPITDKQACWIYLKKRFIRLYPIYVLAIGATVTVSWLFHQPSRPMDVAGYLLFLQGAAVHVPASNGPLWSLSYEVAYYLIFLLVSAQQWRVEWLLIAFIGLAVVLTKFSVGPPVISSFLYGAVFWLAGLLLARQPKSDKPLQYGTMLAFLLLLLSFDRMNLLRSLLQATHLEVSQQLVPNFYDRAMVFSDLSSFLFCVPLLACFTNRRVAYQRWLEIGAFALPGLYVLAYVLSGKIWQASLFNTLAISLLFYFVAVIAYAWCFKTQQYGAWVLQKTLKMGYVSYGLYIIHYPLLYLFNGLPYFSGSLTTLVVRLVAYAVVLSALAWWLERRFQPWAKRQLAGVL